MLSTKRTITSITALLLIISMLVTLCSCTDTGTETQSDNTTQSSDSGTPDGSEQVEDCVIDISSIAYNFASEGVSSTVTVDEKVINTVEPLLFGDNISWRYNGFGIWDSKNDCPQPEILEAIRASGVKSLRYPGGIEGDYTHWYEMIGEDRVPQLNPWTSRAQNAQVCDYPYFGYEEFFEVCDELGIPVVIQLNCGNGTPKEAADLVKWCVDTGKNVSSFCLGNEMHFGEEMVPGITVTKRAYHYTKFFLEFYELLGDYADKIELGIVGLTKDHCISYFRGWDEDVLPEIGDKIDFYDAHLGYTPYRTDDSSVEQQILCYLASATYIDRVIDKQLYSIKKYSPDSYEDITLQITEWGCLGGAYINSMVGTAFHAALLGKMTEEPKISSVNHFSVILTNEGAPTLVGYRKDGDRVRVFENGQGMVFRWFSEQSGRSVLGTRIDSQTFTAEPVGLIPTINVAPTIYTNVYLDEATGEGSIILTNCHYKKNEMTEIRLPFGVEITQLSEVYSVDPLSRNKAGATPISEKQYTVENNRAEDGKITISTKPISVVKIDFKKLDK